MFTSPAPQIEPGKILIGCVARWRNDNPDAWFKFLDGLAQQTYDQEKLELFLALHGEDVDDLGPLSMEHDAATIIPFGKDAQRYYIPASPDDSIGGYAARLSGETKRTSPSCGTRCYGVSGRATQSTCSRSIPISPWPLARSTTCGAAW